MFCLRFQIFDIVMQKLLLNSCIKVYLNHINYKAFHLASSSGKEKGHDSSRSKQKKSSCGDIVYGEH